MRDTKVASHHPQPNSILCAPTQNKKLINNTDSLRGSSVKIGTILRILAWPLSKDDTHKSRSVTTMISRSFAPCPDDCVRCCTGYGFQRTAPLIVLILWPVSG